MFDRFTDRARKAMGLAWQRARRLGHDYIGTEHVLLGLVEEGSGVASDVFKNLDVDPRRIRDAVEGMITRGDLPDAARQLPFTPRMRRALELALEEARGLGHDYIGTEHLLLGLIREKEGIAAQVLKSLNVSLDHVREEIFEILDGEPHEDVDDPGPLTGRARTALEHASREARHFQHERIGTEHILLGVLDEASRYQEPPERVRRLRLEIERLMTRGTARAPEGPLPYTAAGRAAMDLAFQAAGEQGLRRVCVRHLILGLIREKEGIAARVLGAAGITADDLVASARPDPRPARPAPAVRLGFDRFADRSRQALGLARQAAQRWSHDYIGTEHMLLGLLEADGGAVDLLRRLDVDPARVRDETARRMTRGNAMVTMGQLPFTPRAKKVLELALEAANELRDDAIRDEHLLLGIAGEGTGIAAQALAALGVTHETLRNALGPPGPPE